MEVGYVRPVSLPETLLKSFAVFLSVAQTFLEKPNNVRFMPSNTSFSNVITVWHGYSRPDLQLHHAI